MKRILFLLTVVITALTMSAQTYVDLGLPSGTLWKDKNEPGPFCTYDEAFSKFGDAIPAKWQFEELISKCTWQWTGNGYKVIGLNGKSIFLPAAGNRGRAGDELYAVGTDGTYWSSTYDGEKHAWFLSFNSTVIDLFCRGRKHGFTIRLVK